MDTPIPRHFVCLEQDCHLVFTSIYEWDIHSRRHRSQNMKLQAAKAQAAARTAASAATPTIPHCSAPVEPLSAIASVLPVAALGHRTNNPETASASPTPDPVLSREMPASVIFYPPMPTSNATPVSISPLQLSLASTSDSGSSRPMFNNSDVPVTENPTLADIRESHTIMSPLPEANVLASTGEVDNDSFATDTDIGHETTESEYTESDESDDSEEDKERTCSWTARSTLKKEKQKKIDNCHVPLSSYELLARHYLLHLKALGPFLTCPSLTCRMNFSTLEDVNDHVMVMHPSLRPTQPPTKKVKLKPKVPTLSKRKMTRQMSSGGKSPQTTAASNSITTIPGVVTASRPPNRLQQKTQQLEEIRKANKQKL